MKEDSQWTQAKDDRRCDLIDLKLLGTIRADELVELAELQKMAERHFDRIAPPDLAGAAALYEDLLKRHNP